MKGAEQKVYLCAIVKDEELDIMEWSLFHLFQGFDKIIVYDNGSSDRTPDQLSICSNYGSIDYIYWPEPYSQLKAYLDCIQKYKARCDWIAFLDVDEFLVLPRHKYIKNFLTSFNQYNAIAINWRMFGSCGHKTIPQSLITESFNKRAPEDFSANRHVKSIVRPNIVRQVVNPHYFRLRRLHWLSLKKYSYVSSEGLPIEWLKLGKAIAAGKSDIARIHHYFTKSLEHYQRKMKRGNADKASSRPDVFEFNDRNEVADNSITEIYADEIQRIRKICNLYRIKNLNNELQK